MKSMTRHQRRILIRSGHAAVAIGTLCIVVVILYALGLPSIVAIVAGASLAGVVSVAIRRNFLPESPPWSDEERVRLPRLKPAWLPLGLMAAALLYFVAHIPLAIAGAVVVLSIGALVGSESRLRRKAKERLQVADEERRV